MFSTVQIILMPISFGLLFALMLLYWVQAAMFSYTKYNKLTTITFFLCILSLTLLLICRFIDSGHLPLSNLYESLLFLSWSFLVIQLFLQINNKSPLPVQATYYTINNTNQNTQTPNLDTLFVKANKDTFEFSSSSSLVQDQFMHFLGVVTSPMALLTYGFAFLNLPKEMQKATSLVPALQSNWLMMHVTVMICSYAALLCGSIFSMAFLFLNFLNRRDCKAVTDSNTAQEKGKNFVLPKLNSTMNVQEIQDVSEQNSVPFNKQKLANLSTFENEVSAQQSSLRALLTKPSVLHQQQELDSGLSLAEKLDNYSYRVLALGFPLLTIGILSGAVWANQAWGSYWSWDPKESWALITWLIFAIYLHARITKGWSGQKPAMIATLGFFVVWFCYLGVNLLGAGLHSYGWFSR